jgi:hypothetical protein
MQIKEGGSKETTILDPYNVRGTPFKVAEYIFSMDDELVDVGKNRSCTPNMNELDDGEVSCTLNIYELDDGEKPFTWSKAKRGEADPANNLESKYSVLESSWG